MPTTKPDFRFASTLHYNVSSAQTRPTHYGFVIDRAPNAPTRATLANPGLAIQTTIQPNSLAITFVTTMFWTRKYITMFTLIQ